MKSVLKRGNVIMDNEIKNVFFDIEMLRRRLIRPFFIELGLTVGQGQPRILKELRQHGTMNQKELADACLMDVTTMSRTLDRMEKDGLLKRENNPASRRSWNVLLTDCGHEKADEVIKIFNKVDDVIFKGFSEEEIKMLSGRRLTMKSRNKLIIRWVFYLLGLGLGTILSMIGVGRVIAVFNKLFKEHMETVAFDYVEE